MACVNEILFAEAYSLLILLITISPFPTSTSGEPFSAVKCVRLLGSTSTDTSRLLRSLVRFFSLSWDG